jgi:hypothetical protein
VSEVDGVDEIDGAQRPVRPPLTPAQRRARRQTATLLAVGGLLLVAFLFAAASYGGWFDKPKAAAPPCKPVTTTVVRILPSQIHLNVYNASSRNGLAREVGTDMRTRGFVVGKVANDPLKHDVKTTAEVRYGSKGKAAAQLVVSEVPGAKLVEDKRKDASVDLVLGGTYSKLSTTATPGATPSSTCTPTASPTTTAPAKTTKTTAPKSSPTTSKKH